MRSVFSGTSLLVLCVAVGTASAQTEPQASVWRHGTTASGIAAFATDGPRSGPALGGAVGWEITPRIALEGDAAWLRFGAGLSAFSASLKGRVRFFGTRPLDPFFEAGVGLYRASVSTNTTEPVPAFYQRRLREGLAPGASGTTFTDPALVAGGGVNIHINRQFALRPVVDMTLVLGNGDRYVVTTVGVQAVVHFEDHPVTPSIARRRR
jgi:hypothetical protein